MNIRINSILIFLLITSLDVFSQNDSVKVELSQELLDSSDYNYKRKYQYLDINLKEEKNLIKIGTAPIKVLSIDNLKDNDWTLDLNINYECKIDSAYSFIFGVNPIIVDTRPSEQLYLKIYLEGRYYFAKTKEMKYGVSANNSYGKYVGLHLAPLSIIGVQGYVLNPYHVTKEIIQANFGVQRRLGNFSYIDAYGYLGYYDDQSVKVGFSIYFGFAKGW